MICELQKWGRAYSCNHFPQAGIDQDCRVHLPNSGWWSIGWYLTHRGILCSMLILEGPRNSNDWIMDRKQWTVRRWYERCKILRKTWIESGEWGNFREKFKGGRGRRRFSGRLCTNFFSILLSIFLFWSVPRFCVQYLGNGPETYLLQNFPYVMSNTALFFLKLIPYAEISLSPQGATGKFEKQKI